MTLTRPVVSYGSEIYCMFVEHERNWFGSNLEDTQLKPVEGDTTTN